MGLKVAWENHVTAGGGFGVTSKAHNREACYAVLSNPLLLRRIAPRTVKAHGMVIDDVAAELSWPRPDSVRRIR